MKNWCPLIKDCCREDMCVCYGKDSVGAWCTYLKSNMDTKEQPKKKVG